MPIQRTTRLKVTVLATLLLLATSVLKSEINTKYTKLTKMLSIRYKLIKNVFCKQNYRFLHYIQGQEPEAKVREYFYFIDHQGMVRNVRVGLRIRKSNFYTANILIL